MYTRCFTQLSEQSMTYTNQPKLNLNFKETEFSSLIIISIKFNAENN